MIGFYTFSSYVQVINQFGPIYKAFTVLEQVIFFGIKVQDAATSISVRARSII